MDYLLAGHIAVEAGVGAAFGVDVGGRVHHVDGGQMVALAEGKVVGIVGGGDLDGACAEVAAYPLVEDDGDLAAHQWQAEPLAVEMQVALVFRVNGNGCVAEHGFGAGGGDGEKLTGFLVAGVEDRVADLPKMALVLVEDHFEVADGGLAAGAPVHDVCAAIDESLLVKADEGLADGDREVVVHGEVFALPVDRGAETLHLAEDGAAVVAFPLPDALNESVAAKLLAGVAFLHQLALDHHLGGDAGVIGAGQPEGAAARHAPPAGEDVHLRLVEHVAHVQAAGDVGRRQQDGEGLAWRRGGRIRRCIRGGRGLGEEVLAHPVFGPVIFNGGGVVGFGQVVGHGGLSTSPRGCAPSPLAQRTSSEGTTPHSSRWGRCGSGSDQPHRGEICRVSARIPGQQCASEHGGVRADEEVGEDVGLRSAFTAI